jgi:hypothetical protein
MPKQKLSVRRGYSLSRDAAKAAQELYESIYQPDIGLAMFFCSAQYDLDVLAAELHRRFGDIELVGCTSAGEIIPSGYVDRSISGFSLGRGDCFAASQRIAEVSHLQVANSHAAVENLLARLHGESGGNGRDKSFAILLCDGLCGREEVVASAMHSALGEIPLFGGSAGDDLRFESTHVYHQGQFHRDSALLILARMAQPFKVFKSQSIRPSDVRMVVTEADPANRVVREINAEPAAAEYSRLTGSVPGELNVVRFAENPLVVKIGGEYHVRSILQANPDSSLSFAGAIDEGLVLTLARSGDIIGGMRDLFAAIRAEIGQPQLIIGFDCVYRYLELEKKQLTRQAGELMAQHNVVGFCTYGEQFGALHVNQTFTGVAIA